MRRRLLAFATLSMFVASSAAVAQIIDGAGTDCPECAANTIADLQKIVAAGRAHTFGEVASAITKRMDAEHDALMKKRGCGTMMGNHAGEPAVAVTPPPIKTDCTEFVLSVLRQTFAAQGRSADFDRAFAKARETSGAGGFRGTELMKALQTELGWSGMYWAGDLDADAETRYGYYLQKKNGTYYGIKVDPTHAVTGFKTGASPNFEKLKKLPFALLTTKGGMHMGVVLNGHIYELHWSNNCDSPDVLMESNLPDWIWSAGAMVAPPEEVKTAWGSR
jgi:hypothetical protein